MFPGVAWMLCAESDPFGFSDGSFVRYVPLIVAVGTAIAGLIVLALGLRTFRRAQGSATWPAVEGTVTVSQLDSTQDGALRPNIQYAYVVNGQTFTGDRLKAGRKNLAAMGNAAQAATERYPKDSRVRVFFDPADPSQSALEPGVDPTAYVVPGIGLLLLVTAVIDYFVVGAVLKK